MTHVINPMLFYWCSVSDTAKALAIIAAIMLIIVCLVFLFVGAFHIGEAFNYGGGEDSDNYKVGAKFLNWAQKCIVPLAIALVLFAFIPSEKNTVQNDGCEYRHIREYRSDCRNH
jgi:Na+-driven multidrug efflux pump